MTHMSSRAALHRRLRPAPPTTAPFGRPPAEGPCQRCPAPQSGAVCVSAGPCAQPENVWCFACAMPGGLGCAGTCRNTRGGSTTSGRRRRLGVVSKSAAAAAPRSGGQSGGDRGGAALPAARYHPGARRLQLGSRVPQQKICRRVKSAACSRAFPVLAEWLQVCPRRHRDTSVQSTILHGLFDGACGYERLTFGGLCSGMRLLPSCVAIYSLQGAVAVDNAAKPQRFRMTGIMSAACNTRFFQWSTVM